MTDWKEAGRTADAHRIRDLYRASFGSPAKSVARERVIEALRAAGVTTVLDLWGGGQSALDLVAAGFRVISVDDGSMVIEDHGHKVRAARKKRALEYAAAEGGYEARFGPADRFAAEADGAYLDFCGPWSASARRAVTACRHMKAVAVTLTPDHDTNSGATSNLERNLAYQLFLKMCWADRPRWEYMHGGGHVRRLLDYRRGRGFSVYVYLLSHAAIKLSELKLSDRLKTRPDWRDRVNARKRAWYQAKSPEERQTIYQRKLSRSVEYQRMRYQTDPAFRAKVLLKQNHSKHLRGITPRKPCELCESGRLGAASPA
jgi:hypothetical protein